jgi:hypothetical protein
MKYLSKQNEFRNKEKISSSSLFKVHLETFKIYLDEKTFVRYYEAYVLGKIKEIDIDLMY